MTASLVRELRRRGHEASLLFVTDPHPLRRSWRRTEFRTGCSATSAGSRVLLHPRALARAASELGPDGIVSPSPGLSAGGAQARGLPRAPGRRQSRPAASASGAATGGACAAQSRPGKWVLGARPGGRRLRLPARAPAARAAARTTPRQDLQRHRPRAVRVERSRIAPRRLVSDGLGRQDDPGQGRRRLASRAGPPRRRRETYVLSLQATDPIARRWRTSPRASASPTASSSRVGCETCRRSGARSISR